MFNILYIIYIYIYIFNMYINIIYFINYVALYITFCNKFTGYHIIIFYCIKQTKLSNST